MINFLCRLWNRARQPGAAPWLVLATGIWLGYLSWVRALHLPDEGRYVGVAWDMARSGSISVPLLNGLPYFHKPPLFYWIDQLAFAVFGLNEWAARVPSWLAAWGSAIGLYFFVRKYRGADVATLALAMLVTMPLFYAGAQYANLDMLVAGMMTLTILAGAETVLRWEQNGAWRAMSVATGAFAALAILSKGLIGVVLPGGVLFFWIMLTGRWQRIALFFWPPAVAVFLVVAVPWFWQMQSLYPDFYDYFFVHQHYERFVGENFNNEQPFWFYLPVILGLSLPWSIWLPGLLLPGYWRGEGVRLEPLLVIWFLVVAIFFSIPASKLIGYVMPTLAPLAVLLAEAAIRAMSSKWSAHVYRTIAISLAGAAIACVVSIGVFWYIQTDSARAMGRLISKNASPDDIMVYSHSYPFDLAFYVKARKPAWVVEDWPAIPKRDNWRNELVDAARFNPALGKEVLVTFDNLVPRMCQNPNRVFWIRGDHWELGRWPFLRDVAPFFRQPDDGRLWRVVTDDDFRAKYCQG